MNKVLVASRGEIAIRIMRACRELGIKSVAVYSEADEGALFARYADEACCIGPGPAAESYLSIPRIMQATSKSGADAIHPGYGFLAENASFAQACEAEGVKFIGPPSETLRLVGDKVTARREMGKAGVPVVPGSDDCVADFAQARDVAQNIGYPVMVKPSGGAGGIGIVTAADDDELHSALDFSRLIATAAFGSAEIYIEKCLPQPRHIEFQVLGDATGNVVHLGDRECPFQRRYQKLIEEAPSPTLTPQLRDEMAQMALKAARWVKYQGAGTIEFIVSDGKYHFLEANTRIAVAHSVTEVVTGIDIVREMIQVAAGQPLSITQGDVRTNGCAIQCRINAEDPLDNFVPSPGELRGYRSPGGIGVRVDSGVHTHYTISPLYDPMISKLIVWGRDRNEAIVRMRRALYEYIIVGVKTNIPFHKAVMEHPTFIAGQLGTHFIDREPELLADDIKRIVERDRPLEEKLSRTFEEERRMATISAVTSALSQMQRRRRSEH